MPFWISLPAWTHEEDEMQLLELSLLLNPAAGINGSATEQAALEPISPLEMRKYRWAQVIAVYGVVGFEHILPAGLDHILFVLGLFLLSLKLKPLLWQISAFTLAHSLTLGLSMFGYVQLPSSWVEPLIALSICYVAIENTITRELKPWRPLVVFAFGLLHGLGFAGVLLELGLPKGDWITALVGFNLGVEIGQLAVIALAFLAVGHFRHKPWYRIRVTIPASLAIAAAGTWWTIARIFL